jgi:hypothetical protein
VRFDFGVAHISRILIVIGKMLVKKSLSVSVSGVEASAEVRD